jgi:serine/threonine-protein kinase
VCRFARWCRRRPLVAGLAAALAVSVVLGVGGVYQEWRRVEASRAQAEERGRAAEENFRLAHDAVVRFYDEFWERDLKNVPGLKDARRRALTDARGYFERFVAQRGDDPKLRRELAATHFRIAAIDHTTGALPEALAGYERALAAYDALAAETPDDPKVRRNLPRTLQRLATVQASLGRPADALATGQRARALFEDLVRAEPD